MHTHTHPRKCKKTDMHAYSDKGIYMYAHECINVKRRTSRDTNEAGVTWCKSCPKACLNPGPNSSTAVE